MRILCVCLGNICRSPLAEGLLQRAADQAGLHWQVDSAGTAGWHEGAPPHRESIAVAKDRGLDISRQRSRPVRDGDFDFFDLMLAMDADNLQTLEMRKPADSGTQIMLFMDPDGATGEEVADPWGGPRTDYEAVFKQLERGAKHLVERLKAQATSG